jgi:uncharacterized membrane protein YjjB (DUF3815 family)
MNSLFLQVAHQSLFGGVAATGFAVLFNCRPSMLPLSFGAGMLALGTRTILQGNGFTLPVASFFAAVMVSLTERLWNQYATPRGSILAVVGVIPMVPGSVAAKVIIGLFAILHAGLTESVEAVTLTWENSVLLMFTLGAIGSGLALPSLFETHKERHR